MRCVVFVLLQIMERLFKVGKVAWDVVVNAVWKHCTFENDTKYKVIIVDYDGTHSLEPAHSQGAVWYICFSLGNAILDKKTI